MLKLKEVDHRYFGSETARSSYGDNYSYIFLEPIKNGFELDEFEIKNECTILQSAYEFINIDSNRKRFDINFLTYYSEGIRLISYFYQLREFSRISGPLFNIYYFVSSSFDSDDVVFAIKFLSANIIETHDELLVSRKLRSIIPVTFSYEDSIYLDDLKKRSTCDDVIKIFVEEKTNAIPI